MRSRDDGVDRDEAVRWALGEQIVGVGERLDAGARSDQRAVERIEARRRRFASVPTGSFVWTWAPRSGFRLGQLTGPSRECRSPVALRHDLVEVRACRWIEPEIEVSVLPAQVLAAFGRGGRNFQQIRGAGVEDRTAALWDRGAPDHDRS